MKIRKSSFMIIHTGMLAARGVWMCLYFSHPDVQMLDGGLSKWTGENLTHCY